MSEWIETELKNLTVKIGSGATPRGGQEAYKTEGISLIRSQNILDFSFSTNGLAFIDDEQARQLQNVEIQEKDVLINITGDSVARVCMVPAETLPARVNQHVAILRADSKKLDPDYLLYYLLNPVIKRHLLRLSSDGATRNALTKSNLEELIISAPKDIIKQREIAEKIKLLDSKISLLRQHNETLEELAQTLFKRWFVEFEFPDKNGKPYKSSGGEMIDSELGEIPEGWRVGKLSEIMLNHDNKRIPLSSNERLNRKGKYPYHGATSIMDYIDDFLFDGRYVLLGEDGSVVNDEGLPILQFVDGKFWVNNHAHVLEGKGVFSTNYLYLLLRKKNINHIVTGAVQLKINQGNLNGISVLIGKNDTHDKFNQLINPLFNQYFLNKNEIQSLTKLRDTLLPKLMSGELNIQSK